MGRVEVAQLTIHQRIIIRIPRIIGRRDVQGEPRPVRWVEKKGPKCVPMKQIMGAVISADDSVDLLEEKDARVRAMLDDDCPALDFYAGFYLRPTPDGMICADRDSFQTRSGATCGIDEFRKLVAKR